MRRAMKLYLPAVTSVLCAAACGAGSAPRASAPPATSAMSSASSVASSSGAAATSAPASSRSVARSSAATSAPATSPAVRTSSAAPAPATRARSSAAAAPKGTVVVLNPGHNGGDASHTSEINRQVPAGYGQYKACDTTGTETNAGYSEHAFNWSVSRDIATVLRAHGITVVFTRPNDTGVGPCVDRRAAIGNHSNVAAVISIHADGAASSGHGFHVNQASRRPDGATAAVAAASDRLGEDVHAALVRSSGLVTSTYIGKNGYYYRSDLAGLNLATRPATFLELGNMRNSGDAALQTSAAGRQRIATAVANGILAYLGR